MKFSDLKFDRVGCCGCEPWANVQHDSGLRSEVRHNCEGDGFTVAAFCGNTLIRGERAAADEAAVEALLEADAGIPN